MSDTPTLLATETPQLGSAWALPGVGGVSQTLLIWPPICQVPRGKRSRDNADSVSNVALFLHLTGVMLFVAGIVVAGVGFEAARRRSQPAEIALLLSLTRTGVVFVMSGGLLLFACGFWLVSLKEIGFDTGWVDAAIALFVLAMVIGGLAGQKPKKARQLATQLAEEGRPVGAELRALLDDPASRLANYASAALILAILALMVFKP